MPICKRDGFHSEKNKNETFNDNDEVFYCEATKEIFRDYEDYFRHIMIVNSTVWQCEATGKENLTYAEARKSERRAQKKMETFKDSLRPAVMLIVEHARQSSFKALDEIVYKFLRKRYFLREEVSAVHATTKYHNYIVMGIIPPGKEPASANVVYEDTDALKYKLKRVDREEPEIVVPYENIRRTRHDMNIENLHMFTKQNVVRVDGILTPKPESYQLYVTQRKLSFAKLFIGKMPSYTPAKIRPVKAATSNGVANSNNNNNNNNAPGGKKQSSMSKYLVKQTPEAAKKDKQKENEVTAQREKANKEKAEAKAKSLREQMEQARLEKQQRRAEQERLWQEKRAKLIEKVEEECTSLLTKSEDLMRKDQRKLPAYTTLRTYISPKLMGDAFMLREFFHSFSGILSSIEAVRSNLNFYDMTRAFSVREVVGPLSDILLILLGSVFDMQKEEEEESPAKYSRGFQYQRDVPEPQRSMCMASRAHFYVYRHFSLKLQELPLDATTLSEVLRLHLLGSGALVDERTEKYRLTYRNGYATAGDPGLWLRMRHPHILRALQMYSVYQLPFLDIMRIIRCLMSQILTYSNTLNLIEERMEEIAQARVELRELIKQENKRVQNMQITRKALLQKHSEDIGQEDVREDAQKKAQMQEKLDKKVAELLAKSEGEHKKYQQELEKLHNTLFDHMVFLGMDRAYRKYYVLESMNGIFVEHTADEGTDQCLKNPPTNCLNSKLGKNKDLPKNRKDLRTYLMRVYTEAENKEKPLAKTTKHSGSLENKENENKAVNGIAAAEATANSDAPQGEASSGDAAKAAEPAAPVTQYELHMCTGDPKNCIVHDPRNPDRQLWAFFYKEEEIDALIAALNPQGERESQLLENLTTFRKQIVKHAESCPVECLTLDNDKELKLFKNRFLQDSNRKYQKANYGFSHDADLNDVLYTALINQILKLESDVYTGNLGELKVKDMEKWRQDLANDTYDPQVKLQWGPIHQNKDEEIKSDTSEQEGDETEAQIEGQFHRSPYVDPGSSLGETLEIDSEDSDSETISLHDSPTIRSRVKQLASALLQVELAIERRFLKDPFGVAAAVFSNKKESKVNLERKARINADHLKQWEVSLMESVSYSQIFLHLNILNDAIMWSRSSANSRCQACRRGSDSDKMLLCDNCNCGMHMFCMKPKMKTVPQSNWYCPRCVTMLGFKNVTSVEESKKKDPPKKKRKFIIEDDDENEMSSEASSAGPKSRRAAKKSLKYAESSEDDEDDEEISQNESQEEQQSEAEEEEEEEEELEQSESGVENKSAADNDNDVEEEDEGEEEDEDEEEDLDENEEEDSQMECDDFDSANETQNSQESQYESQEEQQEEEDESVCNVCRYDGSEVTCSQCENSFHLECINLKRAPRFQFVCSKCKTKEAKKRKNKASDNTSDEETESSSEKPKRSRRSEGRHSMQNGHGNEASTSSSSRRSYRRTGENLPLNSALLYDLLDEVMKHKMAWPFLRPVTQAEVPDYYEIIKSPMDFAKVKSKLNMGAYQLNEELLKDIQLIFRNCDTYNVEGNEIFKAGCELEKYVMECCKKMNLPFEPSDMNA